MAAALPKTTSALDRAAILRILDLPTADFRVARMKMTEEERELLGRVWQEESAAAIADYNRRIEEHGLPLAKYRAF